MLNSKPVVALLGKEAELFSSHIDIASVRVLKSHTELQSTDDVAFALSYTKIIPNSFLLKPLGGVFVNHSSDLPKGRGWAPLQWSLINRYSEVTVTLFKANAGLDSGPWYSKKKYPIEEWDTIYDLYQKDFQISLQMILSLIEDYSKDCLPLNEQSGVPTYWPKRQPSDSLIVDVDARLYELWPLIRSCDNMEYPAHGLYKGRLFHIYHSKRIDNVSYEETDLDCRLSSLLGRVTSNCSAYFKLSNSPVLLNLVFCND